MKNKLTKTVITILTAACMTGCGAEHFAGQHLEGMKTEYVEAAFAYENMSQTRDEVLPKQQGTDIQPLNTELFDGNAVRIWKGKENTLLAQKEDTLYLYDVVSAQIKAETQTEHWNWVDVYPYKDGYCAIGQIIKGKPNEDTASGGGPMMMVAEEMDVECMSVFYDDSLKEMRKVSLFDIVENAEVAVWSVSPDGAMLGCFDQWEGLNLYDIQNQKKVNLLEPGDEGKCPELLTIDAMFFDADNSQVVFTGQTNQNGRTVASWGRIRTDGTGLENHILQHNLGMASGYGDGKLLLGEDSIFFKGAMGFVNQETGEAVYKTDLKGALPMSGPFYSDDGTIFATAALDTNQMELTVWRTQDFSPLSKEVIQDDREEMFYRAPQVCLFPEIRVCIVCMGGHNDIPQKAVLVHY
ncbi:MAG: hypothetical protein K2G51_15645 [Lachnospiraceae bacterium]|nr:hypothetical protein [Lachnospiraceae bacterium]